MCGMLISADSATDLGATTVVAQALSPTQKTCLFTNGNKANVSVCGIDMEAGDSSQEPAV